MVVLSDFRTLPRTMPLALSFDLGRSRSGQHLPDPRHRVCQVSKLIHFRLVRGILGTCGWQSDGSAFWPGLQSRCDMPSCCERHSVPSFRKANDSPIFLPLSLISLVPLVLLVSHISLVSHVSFVALVSESLRFRESASSFTSSVDNSSWDANST